MFFEKIAFVNEINRSSRLSRTGLFAFKSIIWLVTVGVLFKPAIAAQPAGDDLINPFYMFYDTNGSFFGALKVGVEYGTSHKFDIIGQIIFVMHSWLWIQFDFFTGLNHMWFYAISKGFVFSLALLAGTFWIHEILKNTKKHYSFWKILFLFSAVAGTTVQIHNIWSNDPVANYPLSGYASAVFAFVVLGLLVKHHTSDSKRNLFFISFVVSVAILYYQINIALFPAVFIYWLMNSFNWIKGKNYVQAFLRGVCLFTLPTIVVIYGTLLTSGKTEDYGGTTIGSWSKFPKTTAIGLVGSLPGGGWNLSQKNIGSILFPGAITVVVVVILLFVMSSYLPKSSPQILKPSQWKDVLVLLLPGFLFWLAVVSIQTMTSKYQNEILLVGQIYNFYSHGHVFIAGALVLFFIELTRRSIRWSAIALCVFVSFGVVQFQINSQLVTVMRSGHHQSVELLNAFDVSVSDEIRCKSWVSWASINWPEYYEQGMGVGYQQAFRTLHNQDFCSKGTDPIP